LKVRCLNCGLVLEKCLSLKCVCPECGCSNWGICINYEEKIDRESLEMVRELIGEAYDMAKLFLKEKGYMYSEKMGVPDKEYLNKTEKEMDKIDPFHYRKECKKEGLAFEIIDIKDGNKIRSRKIYLNGHIEGFEGNPLITNHILPKIQCLKACLKQMNKDYRDFIEKHLLADLPIETIELNKLYQAQLERIMNIKI